jgi:hypothetical protein
VAAGSETTLTAPAATFTFHGNFLRLEDFRERLISKCWLVKKQQRRIDVKNTRQRLIDSEMDRLLTGSNICCEYLCNSGKPCGNKHGEERHGERVTLDVVFDGLNFKGFICNLHKPRIPKARLFYPLFAYARMIATERVELLSETTPTIESSTKNPSTNGSNTRPGKKPGFKDQKPETANGSKANDGKGQQPPKKDDAKAQAAPKPIEAGGAIKARLNPKRLPWFGIAARRAQNRGVPLNHQLAWTLRGRRLLKDAGFGKTIEGIERKAFDETDDANFLARMSAKHRLAEAGSRKHAVAAA